MKLVLMIASSIAIFASGLCMTYRSFLGAGDALERVLDGYRRYWVEVIIWLIAAVVGVSHVGRNRHVVVGLKNERS